MAKRTNTLLLLGAAAAAAYFIFRGRTGSKLMELPGGGGMSETADEIPVDKAGEGEAATAEKTDAVVTAPKGQFAAALETAQNIASTIKDAAVYVKSGDRTAVVKSGKKKGKKVRRPKLSQSQIDKSCKGLKGSKRRKCIAQLKKASVIAPQMAFKYATGLDLPASDEA